MMQTSPPERKRLFDFIRRRVRNDADAEDIYQDVFYQLLTHYTVTEPIEKMMSWLFTVARNKITDWYRKRRPQQLPTSREEPSESVIEHLMADVSQSPEALHARNLVWEELSDALDELPEEQRLVFILHELEGKSFKEISDLTEVPVNTLLSRKRYAVLHLRETLADLYEHTKSVM